jgi:putative hydrolase of the HAD superfamily
MPLDALDVIFFDAGGTLFRPYPSVGEVYAQVARRHGAILDAGEIERRFQDAWHARNGLASLGASDDKIEREWWHRLVTEVFSGLVTFDDFEAFFAELYDVFARPGCWRLYEETVPVLDQLRRKNYRLGMISNWDHRLFSIVEGLGLKPYFEQVVASSVAGVAKPARGIFDQAVQALGVKAERCLHIGDSLEDDYYGAQRAGLQPLLLDRRGTAYNGVVRIGSLEELLTLLPC